jgi:hypothetical protein
MKKDLVLEAAKKKYRDKVVRVKGDDTKSRYEVKQVYRAPKGGPIMLMLHNLEDVKKVLKKHKHVTVDTVVYLKEV